MASSSASAKSRSQSNGKSSGRKTSSTGTAAKRSRSSSGKAATKAAPRKNTTKRTTAGQNNSTARSKTTSSKSSSNASMAKYEQLEQEIILLIAFACTLILVLSNFNLAGSVGQSIKWLMFGLFGVTAYFIPFVIAGSVLFMLANKNILGVMRIKSAAVYALSVIIAAVWQRLTNTPDIKTSIGHYFAYCSENKTGGGLFGGILCKILSPLGMAGSMVVFIILIIICIIIITEKSFINGIRYGGQKLVREAKLDYSAYKQHSTLAADNNREIKKDNKSPKTRMGNVVKGVTNDLIIQSTPQESEDIDIDKIEAVNNNKDKYIDDIYEPLIMSDRNIRDIWEIHESQKDTAYDSASANMSNNYDSSEPIYNNEQPEFEPVKYEDIAQEYNYNKARQQAYSETFADNNSNMSSDAKVINISDYNDASEKQVDTYSDNTLELEDVEETYPYENADNSQQYEESLEAYDGVSMGSLWSSDSNIPVNNVSDNESDSDLGAYSDSSLTLDTNKENISELYQQNSGIQNTLQPKLVKPADVQMAQAEPKQAEPKDSQPEYKFPPISLLDRNMKASASNSDKENRDTALVLKQTLQNFGVKVDITDISCGPSVTRYELKPELGVKVSKIVSLADDIKLSLAAADIRIEAPIPGKSAIGIEVPNKEPGSVFLRELIESDTFKNNPSKIAFAAGKDIAGKIIVSDIAKMPHLLIAGATGSGKSVCINAIIMSILYKAKPDEVKMIMVDPKVVELSAYNGIPHLLLPVVTDPKKAAGALNWAVKEMLKRYNIFTETGAKNIQGYNKTIAKMKKDDPDIPYEKMPQIVIIIDELADLMMAASGEVEESICRLAQLARAAGIHMVIATQRPSVNVITGLIKANVPSRIAFSVSSGVDSRTIIDMNGAEKLLGKGDMLYFPSDIPKPIRVQGVYVSDDEVTRVVDFLKENMTEEVKYDESITDTVTQGVQGSANDKRDDRDSLFADAGRFVIEKERGSIGMLQRQFKIGFNRAGRIMDQLSEAGVTGPEIGTKPRKILMTQEQFEEYLNT